MIHSILSLLHKRLFPFLWNVKYFEDHLAAWAKKWNIARASVGELKKKLSLLACVYSLRFQWHPRDRGAFASPMTETRAPSLLWPRVNLDSIKSRDSQSRREKKKSGTSARNQWNSKIVVYLIGPFFFPSSVGIQHLKKCTSFALWIYSSPSLRSAFRDTMTLVIFSDRDTQWHLAMCKFVSRVYVKFSKIDAPLYLNLRVLDSHFAAR